MENLTDKRTLGIIVAALIVLGTGIYFYQQNVTQKEEAGKTALYQVQKTYEAETASLPEADRAVGVPLDVDAKFPKTISGLNRLLSEKKVPPQVLFEAGFKLGTLYLDHGQTDKAAAALKPIPSVAKTDFQKASAFYLLGTAEENANQTKEAVKSYEDGLSKNVEGLKGEFMLALVRAHLKLNEKEKAKLYSEKLGKDLPGTEYAKTAEEMIK